MTRKYYLLAIVALLLIPATWILGTHIFFAINPDIALGRPDYVRVSRLLTLAKHLALWGTELLACGLWLLCCVFVLKAKAQSYWWLPLAIFGPFGLAALTMLDDRAPNGGDLQKQFIGGGMGPLARVAYEIIFFVVVWILAYQAMSFWRDLIILREAMRAGVPVDVIIDQHNASGGMWAFSEGMEEMFLVALFYLLRPVCFMAAGFLGKPFLPSLPG